MNTSIAPPAANSGARLRRSAGPAVRHWCASMAIATRQTSAVSRPPAANSASPSPSFRAIRNTFSGQGPAQSITSSDSLTSSAGTGASGTIR